MSNDILQIIGSSREDDPVILTRFQRVSEESRREEKAGGELLFPALPLLK
jgi:hypothetical protein